MKALQIGSNSSINRSNKSSIMFLEIWLLSCLISCTVVCCQPVPAEFKPYQCPSGHPPGVCHLTGMGLTSLPEQLPSNISKLHADNNQIKDTYGAIEDRPFLIEIYLDYNIIGEVTKSMFSGGTGLVDINLAHNRIDHISTDAFCETPKLVSLDLQYNLLKVLLKSGIFECLSSLRTLLLNNNRLISLEAPPDYYPSTFLWMSLSRNPWNCDWRMLWLQDDKLIGFIRDPDGKEHSPQCRNYPDVSFYDIDLTRTQKAEGEVSVKTTSSEPRDEVNVRVGPEEPPTKPVQDKSPGNSSTATLLAWKTVAIVLMVVFGVSLMAFGIRCAVKKRRRNKYNTEKSERDNTDRDNREEQDDAKSTATASTSC